MKSGEIIYGHIVVTNIENDEDFEISLFKQIENLEDWKSNLIQIGTRKISIESKDIDDISVFEEY